MSFGLPSARTDLRRRVRVSGCDRLPSRESIVHKLRVPLPLDVCPERDDRILLTPTQRNRMGAPISALVLVSGHESLVL